ncbi:MAG TPA: cation:dicarboxylase symporter family transporter [Terracidiphilus sp.]|nr:cation:dicarboxylase symporter family transporter [Terracidiphilus sp.]
MTSSTTTRATSTDRIAQAFAAAGVLLLVAGIALSLAHFLAAGETLRWIGVACFLVFAYRKPSLMVWTFFAMIAGVELGLDAPHVAAQVRLPGDLFLRLIRMIVAPLLFATITTGIAGHNELRSVGRVAIKALILFEVVTTLGLIIGVVAMNLSGAGWGVVIPASLEGAAPVAAQAPQTWQQIVLNLFPENIAQAVAQNQILQVAIFSILFGSALAMLPDKKRAPLVSVLQSLADVMFQLTRIVMYLAPLAAGAAMAYTVGSTGLATLLPLAKLVVTYYIALTAFALLVMIPVLALFRVPLGRFIRAVGEPAAIGFATTTSEAALPLAMERMEEFGVPRWIVSFVIPTGYSFNMTGGSVYLSMAAVFVAQAAGIHLTFGRELAVVLVLMAASKGIAGVPRASLVVLLATASAVHLPTAPILLILGVDTLMDMGRTMMNVVGNCMAAAVIGKTEGTLLTSRPADELQV